MKISDILDDYRENELDFGPDTPLSAERIRELTMSKIENRKNKPRRIAFRVLVAAAVIMMLTVSVIAAGNGAEWFLAFFANRSDAEMSEGQIEFVSGNTVEDEQGHTVNGYTVTLESYISDGSTTYARIRIDVPDPSTVLLDNLCFEDGPWLYKNGEPVRGQTYRWTLLEVNNDAGFGIYFLQHEQTNQAEDNLQVNNTELVMTNLVDRNSAEVPLADGTWKFAVDIPEKKDVELLDEQETTIEAFIEDNECVELELLSARITDMGLRIEFEEPTSDSDNFYYFGFVKAVMQDGTEVQLRSKSFGGHDTDSGSVQWVYFEPQSPTPLEDVVYIEFPGGVQVSVNAE